MKLLLSLALAFASTGAFGATIPPSQRVKHCDDTLGVCQPLTANGTAPVTISANTDITYCRVTVGLTAVALRCTGSNLANRKRIHIFNNGNNAIWLGDDTSVTTANGYPIPAPSGGLLSATGYAPFVIEVGPAVTIYAIAGGAGNDVRIMEGS